MDILICPFCLTIFIYTEYPGAECPSCEIGDLEDFYEYQERKEEIDDRNNEDTISASS